MPSDDKQESNTVISDKNVNSLDELINTDIDIDAVIDIDADIDIDAVIDTDTDIDIDTDTDINNLLNFSDKFDKIIGLSNKIEELFESSQSYINTQEIGTVGELENIPKVIFNYIYEKEIEIGNIEYKRTLETYSENDKTDKLIRQIYWRMYEGIVSVDRECCYYIIGIEDSGSPSFSTSEEIFNSLYFISKTISETDLNYSYLLVENTTLGNIYTIVKFWSKVSGLVDFF